jgi:hypothetical protein
VTVDDGEDVLAELEAELPGSCRRRSASSSASVTTPTTTNVVRGLADSEMLDTAALAQIAGWYATVGASGLS